jgi:hypothetical protein
VGDERVADEAAELVVMDKNSVATHGYSGFIPLVIPDCRTAQPPNDEANDGYRIVRLSYLIAGK